MELPNHSMSDLDNELDELLINTALNILVERAEAGDEEARRNLKKIRDDCRAAMQKLERQDQKREGPNA